jgi:ATP-dependent Clp protease ATP-binding subunit ClpA
VARIIGAPPGYVGYEMGGALTEPLLTRPHSVVLLDEIEKAHRDVHQLLLQVFDEGRLTDGRGRTIDFRHTVIVMTSNLGASALQDSVSDRETVLATARAAFPVELWNRIDAPLVLDPLSEAELERICTRLAQGSSERLQKERGIRFSLGPGVARHLVGLVRRDPSLGARPLRHLLTREVEARIAEAILRGRLAAGDRAVLRLEGQSLTVA